MPVLMWISHGERPLRIEELCQALALDPGNIPSQDSVLESCLGLAIVDKETSIVRLTHSTFREYLRSPGILPGAHKMLVEIGLTYLNYEHVKQLPSNSFSALNPPGIPFLQYASAHWGAHVKIELSDRAKLLVLELLSQYGGHVSAPILLKHRAFTRRLFTAPRLFSGLHCATYFGIVDLAALLEVEGCDINQGDPSDSTPLVMKIKMQGPKVVDGNGWVPPPFHILS
ncbi:hypothetical protein L873DRAFT_1891480 [Choiromyces venosus 120613-1]|uniref:GPI inositol-deacylase winged helix domain-containing protein n=1 Tax=Choiromyces venosus 120613-1 TaxID=1336337 RepID=A0A3N4JVX4_9PEZI|nr:hypothetical protein L873DRAFT_1891480 [Choiromyces venosus 120613-1]